MRCGPDRWCCGRERDTRGSAMNINQAKSRIMRRIWLRFRRRRLLYNEKAWTYERWVREGRPTSIDEWEHKTAQELAHES
jgi:hypothetical protein